MQTFRNGNKFHTSAIDVDWNVNAGVFETDRIFELLFEVESGVGIVDVFGEYVAHVL